MLRGDIGANLADQAIIWLVRCLGGQKHIRRLLRLGAIEPGIGGEIDGHKDFVVLGETIDRVE